MARLPLPHPNIEPHPGDQLPPERLREVFSRIQRNFDRISVKGGATASTGGGGEVISVNGKKGVVVLTASDVSADKAGAAATAKEEAEAAAAKALKEEKERAEGVEEEKADKSELPTIAVLEEPVTIKEKTELTELPGLVIPLGASETEIWEFGAFLVVEAGNTTTDIKLGFTAPSGATGYWAGMSGQAGGGGSWTVVTTGSSAGLLLTLAETKSHGLPNGVSGQALRGIVFGGGTAGDIQLEFAQNSSNAANLSILAGSYIDTRKLRA